MKTGKASRFYIFAKLHQDRRNLFPGRTALGIQVGLAAAQRAGDQAEGDGVRQSVVRPGRNAARVRITAQVRGCPGARDAQDLLRVAHQDYRDLLPCYRNIGCKCRRAHPGDDTGLVRSVHGIFVPVLR